MDGRSWRTASPRSSAVASAADQDREERAPQRRRGEAPAQSEDERDADGEGEAGISLDGHQPHVDAHVVAHEQEVVRARATADLLDPHEHEHHDLNHERVDVGRADDERAPSVEWSRPSGNTRTRCASTAVGMRATASPTVNGSDRFASDERPGEERKARADHERARPPLRAARPRRQGPPTTNETPATIVKAASAGLSPRSWPRSMAAAPAPHRRRRRRRSR